MLAPTFTDLVDALVALTNAPGSQERNEIIKLVMVKIKEILK